MKYQFAGIMVPEPAAAALLSLQNEVGKIARNAYGYQGPISHGKSPFHLTLISPGMHDQSAFDCAVVKAVVGQSPFKITLGGIGGRSHHAVHANCIENLDSLKSLAQALRRDLGMNPDVDLSHNVSLLRKFPSESFNILCVAAGEAYEKAGKPRLTFDATSVTVFGKDDEKTPWEPIGHHYFPAGKQAAA